MHDALVEALRSIPKPIFAATTGAGGSSEHVIVHVAATDDNESIRTLVHERLAGAGLAKADLRFYSATELSTGNSLEKLLGRFGNGGVLYDPTGCISNGRNLLALCQAARKQLGAKIAGFYFSPRMRTLYVKLAPTKVLTDGKVRATELAEIESLVGMQAVHVFGTRAADCPAIRIGFGLPSGALVPIDDASVPSRRWAGGSIARLRRMWKPLTIATLFGLGVSTATAGGPAVSEPNLKVAAQGGVVSDESAWAGVAGFTAPIGEQFGLQLEGGAAGVDGDKTVGAAAHLFKRDPESYLVGVFVAHAAEDDFNLEATRVGAEAEIYLNQLTILAKAGYQFSDSLQETAFAMIDLRWYASDNFAINAGGDFLEDSSVGRLEVEYMPGFASLPGLAFNVRGAIGDQDYDSLLGGITYYFGSDASLVDRHRKQDPDSALFSLFRTVEQERAELEAVYGAPLPPG
jgi:hypothetical protein